MRELVAEMFVTLDTFALGEGAPAYFGYHGPDLQRWIDKESRTPEVMLMGRRTYELFAAAGPETAGPGEEDQTLTRVPKVIFSKTLEEPLAWENSRLVQGDLTDEVQKLKAQAGDRLRTIGSVSVVKALLRADLVDRLRLIIFPILLGATGREPLFTELPDIELELLSSEVLDGRLLAPVYRPKTRS